MESTKYRSHPSPNQISNLQSLKLDLKFLASILTFSVMFFGFSLLPNLFNLIQLFACNVSKNYMFLLCNGILVLIVKNAGFFSNYQREGIVSGEDKVKIGNSPEEVVELSVNKTTDGEEVKGQEENNSSLTQVQDYEEEEAEEEAIGLPSAEELHRKCDDFIRRMKEGIKLEAQQVITVHY